MSGRVSRADRLQMSGQVCPLNASLRGMLSNNIRPSCLNRDRPPWQLADVMSTEAHS